MTARFRLTSILVAFLFPFSSAVAKRSAGQNSSQGINFEKLIRPLLAERCFACHSVKANPVQGGLLLDVYERILSGGRNGPAVVPGHPEKSVLVKVISYAKDGFGMPPGGKLPDREIALLTEWVKAGAPGPQAAPRANKDEVWWAFRPVADPRIPEITNGSHVVIGSHIVGAALRGRPREGYDSRRRVTRGATPNEKGRPRRAAPTTYNSYATWSKTPIDRFVLAKMIEKGLHPNPPAYRRTLIRRAYFDLWGLPPSPADVETFVNDSTPHAWEKVIDRLLASPRYGERWGRHWLDIVHYGDTHGYDKDKRRDNAWPYRDYVIRAFNEDKPYSRIIKEQIAGDVLYPNQPEGIIATGFISAGPWDFVGEVELAEGTVEKEKTRLLDRDDMVANTIGTFNSVTIHCARCHDHKFDPIPQRDYYRLQAVFAGVDRGDRPYDLPDVARPRAALEERRLQATAARETLIAKAKSASGQDLITLQAEIRALREEIAALPIPPAAASPTNGYHSAIESKSDIRKWVQVDLGSAMQIDEIRLVPARPTDFKDTAGFGFPARFRVDLSNYADAQHALTIDDRSQADFANPGDSAVIIRGGARNARYIRVTATKLWQRTNDWIFALAELQVMSKGKNVARSGTVTAFDSIEAGRWSTKFLIDGYSSRASLEPASSSEAALISRRAEIERKLKQATDREPEILRAHMSTSDRDALDRFDLDLKSVGSELKSLPAPHLVYAAIPRTVRPIHVLARGDVENPLELAQPGALSCLAGMSNELLDDRRWTMDDKRIVTSSIVHRPSSTANSEGIARAALADWISSPKNSLTWRSIVNRVWQYHFGRGIVDTPNDFGRNGSLPSHPGLLDWLAATFVAGSSGVMEYWSNGNLHSITPKLQHSSAGLSQSLKKLHKLIMLSAVYLQSSQNDPAMAKIDSDNRFLWRMNRRRLDAEEIRDSVLAVSGKLDLTMGGPGFELFRFKDDHSPVYDHTAIEKINDPKGFRRSVYRFVVRSVANPFMECLDCADPNINTPVRSTTITALQALALLNDPFIVQQSEFLAERITKLPLLANEGAGKGRKGQKGPGLKSPLLTMQTVGETNKLPLLTKDGVGGRLPAQIDAALSVCLSRPSTQSERDGLTAYAQKHGLANACRMLFNMNEFVFVD